MNLYTSPKLMLSLFIGQYGTTEVRKKKRLLRMNLKFKEPSRHQKHQQRVHRPS